MLYGRAANALATSEGASASAFNNNNKSRTSASVSEATMFTTSKSRVTGMRCYGGRTGLFTTSRCRRGWSFFEVLLDGVNLFRCEKYECKWV